MKRIYIILVLLLLLPYCFATEGWLGINIGAGSAAGVSLEVSLGAITSNIQLLGTLGLGMITTGFYVEAQAGYMISIINVFVLTHIDLNHWSIMPGGGLIIPLSIKKGGMAFGLNISTSYDITIIKLQSNTYYDDVDANSPIGRFNFKVGFYLRGEIQS